MSELNELFLNKKNYASKNLFYNKSFRALRFIRILLKTFHINVRKLEKLFAHKRNKGSLNLLIRMEKFGTKVVYVQTNICDVQRQSL